MLSTDELFRLRDKAVDQFQDCKLHEADANMLLNDIYRKRQEIITGFNNTMNSLNHEMDRVKDSKSKLFMMEKSLEGRIQEFNSLIAGRRLDNNGNSSSSTDR